MPLYTYPEILLGNMKQEIPSEFFQYKSKEEA